MRLDFSKVANTAPIHNLERNFFSDKKCSYDENYISKKFVLRKLNYNDMRQEVDKLNKVSRASCSSVAAEKPRSRKYSPRNWSRPSPAERSGRTGTARSGAIARTLSV